METTSIIFSTGLDIPSIQPQSTIFGFVDDDLEHIFLLSLMLLIFKNCLYKARENKIYNFNKLKNYITKIRNFESYLKDNDRYGKKLTVISDMM